MNWYQQRGTAVSYPGSYSLGEREREEVPERASRRTRVERELEHERPVPYPTRTRLAWKAPLSASICLTRPSLLPSPYCIVGRYVEWSVGRMDGQTFRLALLVLTRAMDEWVSGRAHVVECVCRRREEVTKELSSSLIDLHGSDWRSFSHFMARNSADKLVLVTR